MKLRDQDQTCFIENESFLALVRDGDTPTPHRCAKIYPSCSNEGTPLEVCKTKTNFDTSFNG